MTPVVVVDPTLLGRTEDVRVSIERGMRHVLAEQTNELERIMATIDDSPYFPMLDHDGNGGTAFQLLTTTESVRAYYGARHGSYEVVSSRHVAAVATEFYTFRESIATLRGVGDVGGVASDGIEFDVNSAVLFPTGPGGIGGEIVWTRFPFGDVVTGSVAPPETVDGPLHLPNLRMRNGSYHDRYLDAWRAGDAAAMAAALTPDARWIRRLRDDREVSYITTSGVEETERAFAAEISRRRPGVIEVLNRVVAEWYVFCDLYVELVDTDLGATERCRQVSLHPLGADGRLRAELGDRVVLAVA